MASKLSDYEKAQRDFEKLPVMSSDPARDAEGIVWAYVRDVQIKLDIIEEGHLQGTDSEPSKADVAKLRRFLTKWAAYNKFNVK